MGKVVLQRTGNEHEYRTPDGRFTVTAAQTAADNPHRAVRWRVHDTEGSPWWDRANRPTPYTEADRLSDVRREISRVLDREQGTTG